MARLRTRIGRPLSLRRRLLLWLLLPVLLLTGVWAFGAYSVILHFTYKAYDRALEDAAQGLAGQVHVAADGIHVDLPQAAREIIQYDNVDNVFYGVFDAEGDYVTGYRDLPSCPAEARQPGRTTYCDGRYGGERVRIAEYLPVTEAGQPQVVARVAETVAKRRTLASEVLRFSLVPQAAFIAGVAALIWWGVGRGMVSVTRIRDAIARRTHQDLSPLQEAGLPAELHEQVRVINDLMKRLDRTIAAQQRFIADATHQLRTPITVLRTQTELALRVSDPAELRAEVVKLDAATARLVRLSNQLLNLSRVEAGFLESTPTASVDVAELVEEVAAEFVPAALHKHLEIMLETESPDARVDGHRVYLKEMLMNLLDNAVRYTPGGGRVAIRTACGAPGVAITIADSGPGIPEPERDKVMQRFHRGATAASGGSGLGLAIAREIAQLHGGVLRLTAVEPEGGLRVEVVLPMETGAPAVDRVRCDAPAAAGPGRPGS